MLASLISAIGSMLAFDQFYIMTGGGPRGQTFTSVYYVYQNSFVFFKLGYGAALSIILGTFDLRCIGGAVLAVAAGKHHMNRATTPLAKILCIVISALMLLPVLLSFFASIKSPAEANLVPPNYLPMVPSLANYAKVFTFQAGLWSYVWNSLFTAILTIALCVGLSVPAGYGLARFSFRFKEAWFLALLATMMIPFQALLTPLYLMFAKLGFANSHLGLAIVHTVIQLPFSIYLMRNSFEAVPKEIEEAALGRQLLADAHAVQNVHSAGHARHHHGGAVCLHYLLERIHCGADLHEQ